jgi:hypothetical protein
MITIEQFRRLSLEEAEVVFHECEQRLHEIVREAFHGGGSIEEMIRIQSRVICMHDHLRSLRERTVS